MGKAYVDDLSADEIREMREAGDILVKVKGGGMGCALIKTSVFRDLVKPWFWLSVAFGAESYVYFRWRESVTGEETLYAPDQVPGWVDHVYPAELLEKEYNFYGLYARGYRPPENKDEAVTRLRDPQPAILDDGLCLRAEIWDNGEEPAQVGVLTADLRTGAGLVSPVT